ncbi:MAG: hypothetical protein QFX31_02405 [Methanothrix sp.]|uniref:hypothetical protein n=1 Tax=Methanothrix sp. TaxID=90426 RepID=UPI0032AFA062|nr:hypothetical protein [Methanothrix sp.]
MNKQTGTSADVFLAYGLAVLLESVLSHFVEDNRWVRIHDQGPYYAIELSHPIQEEWVEKVPFRPLAPYIRTGSGNPENITGLPDSMIVDYQQEWDRFRNFINIPQEMRDKMSQEQLSQMVPHPWFSVFAWVGERRMQALGSYNNLILRWQAAAPYFAENMRHILMLFAKPYEDTDRVKKLWRKRMKELGADTTTDATCLQLLNPCQGKGQNEPKATRLKMDNIKSFWLLEYLKVVGIYHCAVPRVVQGTDDRKTYALAPVNMRLDVNNRILAEFQEAMWNDTAVKMDILAALRYTRCFLDYCRASKETDLLAEVIEHAPEDFVAGMHVVYYKNLGQAAAVMNISFIELPRWMRVESLEDVNAYREVIEEHESIIRDIDEKREYEMLVSYRDFISGRKWDAFFDFTAAYSQFLMLEMSKGNYFVRQFTTKNLEVLIMKSNEPLSAILESPGFRNIADAIRHSTVIPQRRKAKNMDYLYEIRYGLGQELKRKSLYNDEFIAALSEFVHNYNAENARVLEHKGQQMRKDIRTSDLEDIVRLVDRYGAATVGSLLIAFGYAREPKEEQEEQK